MAKFYVNENGSWMQYDTNGIYRKENDQWVLCADSDLATKKYICEHLADVREFAVYVSLGDSIAAGHTIDDNWEKDYGLDSQYGVNGNTETVIVPDSYTDLLRKDILAVHSGQAFIKSFAHSGDTVADLMNKLNHETVQNELKKANLVTVCIGANDVLVPAMDELTNYLNSGSFDNAEAIIETNLTNLNTDSHSTSYVSLFNKLKEINPDAKYVFTTVYNPYKYLHLEEGHNGFFKPLLSTIPQMNIDIDEIIEDMFLGGTDLSYYDITQFKWVSIELELDLDGIIKDGLLGTPAVQQLFRSVNNLSVLAEKYVEGSGTFNGLNKVLRNKINNYSNPNFVLAETKALFDTYPDRTVSGDVHYNDLVSIEFTRGFDASMADWGALWRDGYGNNYAQYWKDLAWKYLSFSNALPSLDVWDYVSFDINGFAADLVGQIIENVIKPDMDPHPEREGHKVLKQSFGEVM